MTSILETIRLHKTEEIKQAKALKLDFSSLNLEEPARNFTEALRKNKPAIIAEIKKASPSKGIIRADFNAAEIADIYYKNGSSCLSILTDAHFFHGDPLYIKLAKEQCPLPILRKDFIIDAYQITESKYLGADCILLIAALLDDQQLLDFCQQAQALGMDVLVESHNAEELRRALLLPTPLIGINNRSLHTFITDKQTSINLSGMVPDGKIVITESGIHTREDIELMQSHGIHAFLIGESLMKSPNIGEKLKEFLR
jgi:indole-3-glycerol phosphate synthase